MNNLKYKYFIMCLILSSILVCNQKASQENDSNKTANKLNKNVSINKIPNENMLKEKIKKLIKYIIDKNVEGIGRMLTDKYKIEIWMDSYANKKKVLKMLRSKGSLYNHLFDTDKYREYKSKGMRGEKEKNFCIRDQILMAQKKGLRINWIHPIGKRRPDKPLFVDVRFIWDGFKFEIGIFHHFVFYFNKEKIKWELADLTFAF